MRCRLVVSVLVLATVVFSAPARAASISFDPASVKSGAFFDVPIFVTGAEDLFLFNFSLAFDPAFVGLVSVSRGDVFSGIGLPCDDCFNPGVTEIDGLVSFIADSISGAVDGFSGTDTVTLAVLRFQARGLDGDAGLRLLSDDPSFIFYTSLFAPMPITKVLNGAVSVVSPQSPNPVPEPSTLALVGVGLAAMARQRLKRRIAA